MAMEVTLVAPEKTKPDEKAKPKKTIVVHIDRKPYKVSEGVLTGAQLRTLPDPDIGPEFDLWLEVQGGEDNKIEPDEKVKLKNKMQFFTAPSNINPGHAR